MDPFKSWRRWLEWLDSHDGRLHRRERGGDETDTDLLGEVPPRYIFTVGDLRAMIAEVDRLRSGK